MVARLSGAIEAIGFAAACLALLVAIRMRVATAGAAERAIAGAGVVAMIGAIFSAEPAQSRFLAGANAALWLSVMSAKGWLRRPAAAIAALTRRSKP